MDMDTEQSEERVVYVVVTHFDCHVFGVFETMEAARQAFEQHPEYGDSEIYERVLNVWEE